MEMLDEMMDQIDHHHHHHQCHRLKVVGDSILVWLKLQPADDRGVKRKDTQGLPNQVRHSWLQLLDWKYGQN